MNMYAARVHKWKVEDRTTRCLYCHVDDIIAGMFHVKSNESIAGV